MAPWPHPPALRTGREFSRLLTTYDMLMSACNTVEVVVITLVLAW